MTDRASILIRADGSPDIGLGHVMRMATLATEASDRGIEVCFAVHAGCDRAIGLLAARGLPYERVTAAAGTLEEARETGAIALRRVARMVVVDGYAFEPPYVDALRDVAPVCYVDDLARGDVRCDVMLNNNLFALDDLFNGRTTATRLVGPRYALVAGQFRRVTRSSPSPVVSRILVTFGGADIEGQSARVLSALRAFPRRLEVRVVVGAATSATRIAAIQAAAHDAGGSHDVIISYDVVDMAKQMAWADVAILGAGSTCLELCCVGVPAIVWAIAENQRRIADACGALGLMVSLGWHEEVTQDRILAALGALEDVATRTRMEHAQRGTVDGLGASRVVDAITAVTTRAAAVRALRPTAKTAKKNVLVLGYPDSRVVSFLRDQEEDVQQTSERVDLAAVDVQRFDLIVSYGYRFILRKPLLDLFPRRAINLHISLLPWNRGADPNLWSFVEDTPKGVTIHLIDEGIDTGDILEQVEVTFDDASETLGSTYRILQRTIEDLFCDTWASLRTGAHPARPQAGHGSVHRRAERAAIEHLLTHGWDTPVGQLRER